MSKYNPYAASAQRSSSTSYNKTMRPDLMKEQQSFTYFSTKKDGDYEIVIIPFKISKKHPAIAEGADVGDEAYSLPLGVHRNIGPKKATYLCPAAMFGKSCPICEAAEEIKRKKGYQDEDYKNLRVKSRSVYNVVDLGDKDKGIQVFEESTPLFEDSLVKTAGAKGRKKGIDFIAFGDGLHSITFSKGTKKIGSNDCAEYDAFDFEDLPKMPTLPKGQKPFAFDEFMNVLSYEELSEIFLGSSDDEDEEEESAPPARRAKKSSDDEDEDVEKASPKGKRGSDENEKEKDSDEESCPADLKFGKDYDRESDDCDSCSMWRECRKLSKE